jgi:hypothetical protein
VVLGGIGGVVLDSSKLTGVPSRIIAYRDLGNNTIADAYYVDSDTNGIFAVSDLPAGKYIVLAIPLGKYAPSFYSITGTTLKWKNATLVDINGAMISGLTIFVVPFTGGTEGFTSVIGNVNTQTGGGGNSPATLVGVNGAIVTVTDAQGTTVAYGVTDETGNFLVGNLAPGTYTVTVDKFGYKSTSSVTLSPSYDAQGNPVTASTSFTIQNEVVVTDVITRMSTVPTEYRLEQNYPNPFNPSTTINFTVPKSERLSLTIYNILGQRVASLIDGFTPAGSYSVQWNAAQLSTGVYFYHLKSGDFSSVKKMMLVK